MDAPKFDPFPPWKRMVMANLLEWQKRAFLNRETDMDEVTLIYEDGHTVDTVHIAQGGHRTLSQRFFYEVKVTKVTLQPMGGLSVEWVEE